MGSFFEAKLLPFGNKTPPKSFSALTAKSRFQVFLEMLKSSKFKLKFFEIHILEGMFSQFCVYWREYKR